jgi:hypothetical protein
MFSKGHGIKNAYQILVGEPKWKRNRRRREDNIKLDLKEIECNGANWIKNAQDRVQ